MTQDLSHHFAQLDDVTLHYVICGRGPVVVLLHGWPQTWYEWRHIIPASGRSATRSSRPTCAGSAIHRGRPPDTTRRPLPTTSGSSSTASSDTSDSLPGRARLGWPDGLCPRGRPSGGCLAARHPRCRDSRRRRRLLPGRPALAPSVPSYADLPEAADRGRERLYLELVLSQLRPSPRRDQRRRHRRIPAYLHAAGRDARRASPTIARCRRTPQTIAPTSNASSCPCPCSRIGGASGRGRGTRAGGNPCSASPFTCREMSSPNAAIGSRRSNRVISPIDFSNSSQAIETRQLNSRC